MTFKAEIVLDSITPAGDRLTTLEATYPKIVHPEILHHRVFSRGASSNRARSILTIVCEVLRHPFVPLQWGKNSKRMQPKGYLSGWRVSVARQIWLTARYVAILTALALYRLGVHKQLANRVLEPWQWITLVITSTEWENFLKLRCHPDAQDECRMIAELIRDALAQSTPVERTEHLPYILPHEQTWSDVLRVQLSVARCARISFAKQGAGHDLDEDLKLYGRLSGSDPEHSGPFEHIAWAALPGQWNFNLKGWASWRYCREALGWTDQMLEFTKKEAV